MDDKEVTGGKPRVEIRPLTDALPDDANLNKHTQRGMKLLENSMRRRGFNRPIAAAGKGAENPVITAGNLTQETAVNIGLDKEAIFVYTDGTRPIVHVRTDVAPGSAEAIALGLEDNEIGKQSYSPDIDLAAQLAAGDSAILSALKRDDKIFGDMLEGMGAVTPNFQPAGIDEQGRLDHKNPVVCPECGCEFVPK